MKVGVHQGSVFSPLLCSCDGGSNSRSKGRITIWELLYADDLVLVAQSKEGLRERVL